MLVLIHDSETQRYGVDRHRTSADISRAIPTDGFFANAVVKTGKPRVWLSVLVPFNEGEDGAKVAGTIKTFVDGRGNVEAHIGRVRVTVSGDGAWKVSH